MYTRGKNGFAKIFKNLARSEILLNYQNIIKLDNDAKKLTLAISLNILLFDFYINTKLFILT